MQRKILNAIFVILFAAIFIAAYVRINNTEAVDTVNDQVSLEHVKQLSIFCGAVEGILLVRTNPKDLTVEVSCTAASNVTSTPVWETLITKAKQQ